MRGWSASRFSFNTAGGRCAACEGQGLKKIEMSFLPDVRVCAKPAAARASIPRPCRCGYAARRRRSARDERGRSGRVLRRASFDPPLPAALQDVGLGYLTLGQQSPTLSGGEAQRIKLVYELSKTNAAIRYVLDEPTVGLHMADVEKLIRVLHRLVDAGNTAVVIEHNLDVIAEADWIIDLARRRRRRRQAGFPGRTRRPERRAHGCTEELPGRAPRVTRTTGWR